MRNPTIRHRPRIRAVLLYKLRVLGIGLAIFTLFSTYLSLPVSLHTSSTAYIEILLPAMIYLFVMGAIDFGRDVRLFLQFGFSRREILGIRLLSNALVSVAASAVVTALSFCVNTFLAWRHTILQLEFIDHYAGGDFHHAGTRYATMFLLCLLMLFLTVNMGLLVSVFLWRVNEIGGRHRLVMAAVITVTAVSLLNLFGTGTSSAEPTAMTRVADILLGRTWHAERGVLEFTPVPFAITLLCANLLTCAITYLLIRRLEILSVRS